MRAMWKIWLWGEQQSVVALRQEWGGQFLELRNVDDTKPINIGTLYDTVSNV